MFRELTRIKQKLTAEESAALLQQVTRGVLAVQGDDGYPYAVPTNHYYDPHSGSLFFHSGIKGHKVDAIRRCDKVSYCVTDNGVRREGDWALTYKSVIVFGRVRIIEDLEYAMDMTRRLSLQFTDDTGYIEQEITDAGDHTLVFELVPQHITGKIVREA